MSEWIALAFLGALLWAIAERVSHDRKQHDEPRRLRHALEYLMRSTDDRRVRRYIAKVLDPDGDEAGA